MTAALFGAAIVLVSCGGTPKSVDFTDQGKIDKNLRTMLGKYCQPDDAIIELDFGTTNTKYTNSVESVDVTYFDTKSNAPKAITIYFSGQEPGESIVSQAYKGANAQSGTRFADIDFSKIASNVNAGIKIMKGNGLVVSGIENYVMVFNGDPAKARHSFELRNQTSPTEYFSYEFEVDSKGEVKEVD